MARRLRMESEAGVYHVLNRGNYRSAIFQSDKTKEAFLRCLDEACVHTGWRVHAWCVMSNHYHLALSTPGANLADGMRWFQGTFALRFNRLRQERGHIFQGRYKSLLAQPGEGLGPLCHYIHLNPVRANICTVNALSRYRWTSLSWLDRATRPPEWFEPEPALRHAGDLSRTPAGVRQYLTYLGWLAEDEPTQRRQRFEAMSKGWVIGTRDFATAVMAEHRELAARGPQLATDLQAAREADWLAALGQELHRRRRSCDDLQSGGKSADWKLQLAAALKARTTVTNRWLGTHLHLGARDEVSRKLNARLRRIEGGAEGNDNLPQTT